MITITKIVNALAIGAAASKNPDAYAEIIEEYNALKAIIEKTIFVPTSNL